MRQALPEMQGLSKRNLEHMRRFAQFYSAEEFAKQAVSQLPWGHIIKLMQSTDNEETRNWYAAQALQHGWSRSILGLQIDSQLFEREASNAQKITNYERHLPKIQSDLALDLLKDPYKFDFLTINEKAKEREIENELTRHIRDFLLELGQGFSFVGTQVPLTFEDEEFFIDMLFYHLKLRCYVVIELKATKFKPAHTGQLGFYLAAVDDQLRHADDGKTIGIILCQKKSKIIAEYALQNINAPIGISEYTLSKNLPRKLKTSLPSIEELEQKLSYSLNDTKAQNN
jgi:predicted nuclease of restriction endonuclease-like (RecB) superfamily